MGVRMDGMDSSSNLCWVSLQFLNSGDSVPMIQFTRVTTPSILLQQPTTIDGNLTVNETINASVFPHNLSGYLPLAGGTLTINSGPEDGDYDIIADFKSNGIYFILVLE
jgi:hypothetical protein